MAIAPLDVRSRARPQGPITVSESQSRWWEPQHKARRSGRGGCPHGRSPMHTHLWLSCTHCWGTPTTVPKVSYKDLLQCNFSHGFLARGSGPRVSHEPWSFSLQRRVLEGSGREQWGWLLPPLQSPSAEVLKEVRMAPGHLTHCVPSRERCSCALHRPFPASCAAAVRCPAPLRRALPAAPSPWKFPRRRPGDRYPAPSASVLPAAGTLAPLPSRAG